MVVYLTTIFLVLHFISSKYSLDLKCIFKFWFQAWISWWRTRQSPISKQLNMFKSTYKGTRGETPRFKLWNANKLFIWCSKCQGGGDARHEISFTKLSDSNDHTLSHNSRGGTIQKPLCHTQLAFAILTTRHGASAETHSVSRVHGSATKSHCNDPRRSRAPHKQNGDQKRHQEKGLGWI